jgi:hypothetical protein
MRRLWPQGDALHGWALVCGALTAAALLAAPAQSAEESAKGASASWLVRGFEARSHQDETSARAPRFDTFRLVADADAAEPEGGAAADFSPADDDFDWEAMDRLRWALQPPDGPRGPRPPLARDDRRPGDERARPDRPGAERRRDDGRGRRGEGPPFGPPSHFDRGFRGPGGFGGGGPAGGPRALAAQLDRIERKLDAILRALRASPRAPAGRGRPAAPPDRRDDRGPAAGFRGRGFGPPPGFGPQSPGGGPPRDARPDDLRRGGARDRDAGPDRGSARDPRGRDRDERRPAERDRGGRGERGDDGGRSDARTTSA